MPRLKSIVPIFSVFLLAVSAIFSCKNEVKVNANWKEIIVVYGLLDPIDTVQFIRVEKAFLDEKTGALEIAKIADSLYLDSAEVILSRLDTSWSVSLQKYSINLNWLVYLAMTKILCGALEKK